MKWPNYYLRHVGDKKEVAFEHDKHGLGVGLTIELTRVGVLWRLEKDDVQHASGVPIVVVAQHFESEALANEQRAKLVQEEMKIKARLAQIEKELDALNIW